MPRAANHHTRESTAAAASPKAGAGLRDRTASVLPLSGGPQYRGPRRRVFSKTSQTASSICWSGSRTARSVRQTTHAAPSAKRKILMRAVFIRFTPLCEEKPRRGAEAEFRSP